MEPSRTPFFERLKKGVSGLSKLAPIFAVPAVLSGVAGQEWHPRLRAPLITRASGTGLDHSWSIFEQFLYRPVYFDFDGDEADNIRLFLGIERRKSPLRISS